MNIAANVMASRFKFEGQLNSVCVFCTHSWVLKIPAGQTESVLILVATRSEHTVQCTVTDTVNFQ